MSIDPREEIAIVLELSRAATEEDVGAVHRLLDDWLSVYEEGPRYRNCGIEGDEVGSRRFVLWADRVDDLGGPEAALERALRMAEEASRLLPVSDFRLSGDPEGDADLQDRLGVPVIAVRPGGDVLGQLKAAGLLPMKEPRPRRRKLAVILPLLGVLGCCGFGWWWAITPGVVRDLPGEASDVHWAGPDRFPDSELYVQARLSEASCRRHVREAFPELVPLAQARIPDDERHWVSWGYAVDEEGREYEWWTPADIAPDNTWVHYVRSSWSIVQCADGHIRMHFFTH